MVARGFEAYADTIYFNNWAMFSMVLTWLIVGFCVNVIKYAIVVYYISIKEEAQHEMLLEEDVMYMDEDEERPLIIEMEQEEEEHHHRHGHGHDHSKSNRKSHRKSKRKYHSKSKRKSKKRHGEDKTTPDQRNAGESPLQMYHLSFKCIGSNVEYYTNDLVDNLKHLRGFKHKLQAHKIKVRSDDDAAVRMIIGHDDEELMDHPAMIQVLDILRSEERVRNINVETVEEHKDYIEIKKSQRATEQKDDSIEVRKNKQPKRASVVQNEAILMDMIDMENLNEENINMEQQLACQEMVVMKFKTKSDDIGAFHDDLLSRLLQIDGFYELIHDHEAKIKSDKKGKMTFLLKQSADTAMQQPAIKNALMLLQADEKVHKLNLEESDPVQVSNLNQLGEAKDSLKSVPEPPKETNEMKMKRDNGETELAEDEAWQELVELKFKTKGEVIQVYHEHLLKIVMDILDDKVHDYNVDVISEKKGKISFTLRQDAADALNDEEIKSVLTKLRAEKGVKHLKMDQIQSMAVLARQKRNHTITRVHKRPTLTHALCISFYVKDRDVQNYVDELIKKCGEMEYFQTKMYQKKVTVMSGKKQKLQLVMFYSESEMQQPDFVGAMDMLGAQEKVSKLCVETIPFFLEGRLSS